MCLANLASLVGNIRGARYSSPVPLVGGGMLFAGLWQVSSARPFAWLALALDWGTASFLIASPRHVKEIWSTSRFCLLEEYTGQNETLKATLQLFRGQLWVLRRDYKPKREEGGRVSLSMTGHYRYEDGLLILELKDGPFTLRPSNTGGLDEWVWSESLDTHSHIPSEQELVLRRK
ncbi:MAG: hypothetical protein HONBIEJF_00761 [Fimbriimonadaceae bacterium]|nr:hypothetical protein [Fimbriimonadaceae bacterium]